MHPTTRQLNQRSITATWRWSPNGCSPGQYQPVTDFVLQFTKRLHDGGVRLLMGSDSPTVLGVPGFSAAREVQSLVNAGIPLVEALARLTSKPADLLGIAAGRLEPGASADLCVFDPADSWSVDPSRLRSQGHNTPFTGYQLDGKVIHTMVGGQIVYE